LGDLGIGGRINIEICIREMECEGVDSIYLAKDRFQCGAVESFCEHSNEHAVKDGEINHISASTGLSCMVLVG
jgi:hypothetical protein